MRATFRANATLVLLAVTAASSAHAQVVFVDVSARPGGDGASWGGALSSLDEALARAAAGDATEIWIREGVYVPTRDDAADPRASRFDVPGGIAIYGGFAGHERSPGERNVALRPTVLSGDLGGNDEIDGDRSDNAYRVVDLSSGTVVLDGVTIRGGQADGPKPALREGAALGGAASEIHLVGCTLTSNEATDGGAALASRGASVTLRGSTIRANRDPHGAVSLRPDPDDAIAVLECVFAANEGSALVVRNADREGQLVVARSSFVANDAGSRSTLLIEASHATVSSCTFQANLGGDGAALHSHSSVTLVRDSYFLDNESAGRGGALLATATGERAVRVERCSFVANRAAIGGATAVDGAARLTIANGTFDANEASEGGGAVASGGPSSPGHPGPTLRLERCILRANVARGAGGAVFANRHALDVVDSLVVGNVADDGGAVRSAFTSARIERSTIAGNRARTGAGGVAKSDGALTLVDSIVWANVATGGDAFASQVSLAADGGATAAFVLVRSCVQGLPREYAEAGGLALDPAFVDLDGRDDAMGTADDDPSLAANSPYLNQGDPTLFHATAPDALGAPRILGCRVDLGALESALQPLSAPDCDTDGTPDACEITDGAGDCNGNGVPDVCEIAAGAADCDGNGVPDDCELAFGAFAVMSDVQQPFGHGAPLEMTLRDPGPAQSDVTFTLVARGDFGGPAQSIEIVVNGATLGTFFETGSHCAHDAETRSYAIPKGDWNAVLKGGDIGVIFVPSAAIDPTACVQSLAQARIEFSLLPSADTNSNGLVDACEPRADLDGDGVVGASDLAELLVRWGVCDGCNADIDRNGTVGAEDLAFLLGAWTSG